MICGQKRRKSLQTLATDIESLAAQFAPTIRPKPLKMAYSPRFRRLLGKLAERHMEGLALYLPLPLAEQFHQSKTKWRICDGSNRSSKTMSGAIEATRAWCGVDPFDKYPKENGNSLVVGLDLDHIAMMWRKCYEPGAFKIIRDEQTKQWRAVRPNPANLRELDPYDLAYSERWRDAPPIVSHRLIQSIAWEDRSKGIPRYVTFHRNWKSLFRSSDGKPPQGDAYNFVWLDEEMANVDFYYEAVRGLTGLSPKLKHTPRGIWTATAQASNHELLELREKSDKGEGSVSAFTFLIEDNPYVPLDERMAFIDALPEEERQVRIEGRYAMLGRRVYPMFEPMGIHTCEPFEIPENWARYVFTDPGVRHCGSLFAAVDPDEKHVWFYDGFDLQHADAAGWAIQVKDREHGRHFEAMVFDQQMGRETLIGVLSGPNVAKQYWSALEGVKCKPRLIGPLQGFMPGSNDIRAREEALIRWMRPRGSGVFQGTSILQLFRGILPLLEKQIKHACYEAKKVDKRMKLQEDLLVCLEYAAAYNPAYRSPRPVEDVPVNPAYAAFQAKTSGKSRRGANGVCVNVY